MKKTTTELTAIVDTREQCPWDLARYGLHVERGTLAHGDYSLRGLERIISIERKSLPDFLACCGQQRARFEKELLALRGYRYRAVIVEAALSTIAAGDYGSQITPAAVLGSMLCWQADLSIPFIFAETPDLAAQICARLLLNSARKIMDYFVASAPSLAMAMARGIAP